MAKKSHKRPLRSKKDNAGCMWGLISMFDYRQGHSTQKLLSDRKRGSDRYGRTGFSRSKFDFLTNLGDKHEDVNDADTTEVGRVNSGMASIKTLMEEEMSRAHSSKKISSSKVEQIRADLGFGVNLEKNHKQTINHFKLGSDHHTNDLRTSCQSSCPNSSENSSFDVNLAELMVEFCSDNHQCQEKHMDCKSLIQINSCPDMETIGDRKHNCLDKPDPQLAQKRSILQKALGDLIKAFLNQKSTNSKPLTGNGTVQQSKEFIDALEMLKSNKELVLKLLQDPDSFPLKNIQDFQNAETGECLDGSELFKAICSSGQHKESISYNLFHKQNGHHFFRKKDKSKGEKQSDETDSSRSLNRIVVSKPSPERDQQHSNAISPSSSPQSHHSLKHQEDTGRITSHFSLKEIKRRLKHVIGDSRKERHLITMDGLLHKIPYGFRVSGDNGKTSCNTGHTSHPPAYAQRGDKKTNSKEYQTREKLNRTTVAHPLYRESIFYEKARKHLAEVLRTDGEDEIRPTRQASKSLGRILSLPEYNLLSPRLSPGREPQSPQQMRFSPQFHFKQENATNQSPPRQSIESSPCTDSKPDDGVVPLDSNPALLNTQLQTGEDLIQKESMEMEECDHLDVPSDFNTNGPCFTSGRCMEAELGPSEEPPVTPSISISPNSLLIQKLEAPESIMENPDRPSPISVLEPFFSEHVCSPERTSDHGELRAQPRQLHFEEHDDSSLVLTLTAYEANLRISSMEDREAELEYVRTVLEASGLSCNKFPGRCCSSDQLLLNPSLFDEVEISDGRLKGDPKLLFDCIGEVLGEIQERHFSCTPWVSIIKPNTRPIPVDGNFIQEVCKGVDWHLHSPFPCTLDQLVRKDMDGGCSWLELRFDSESTVSEVGEAILGYIMEETILELWD